MVADGLSIVNADYSSTSFRVSRATIGPHKFLGNKIVYPSRGGPATTASSRPRSWFLSTARSGRARASRVPQLRDPASVQRDTHWTSSRAATSWAAASPPRTGTTPPPWRYLLVRWLYFLWVTLLVLGRRRALRHPVGAQAIALGNVLVFLFAPCTSCWPSGPSRPPIPGPAVLLDPRPASAPGTVLEGPRAVLPPDPQRHPVQERDLAPARGPDRAWSSTTGPPDRADAGHPSGTAALSTLQPPSSATPRRTAPSSPTTSRSPRAAHSGSAPSSITAWRWLTTRCSRPIRSS